MLKSITVIVGKVCSGKNSYAEKRYSHNSKIIDIGDIVRSITNTNIRIHDISLDNSIIEILRTEIDECRKSYINIVFVGIRQKSVVDYLQKCCEIMGLQFEPIILSVPDSILIQRFDKRNADKDSKLSFEEIIERDNKLGLTHLIAYLILINCRVVNNYDTKELFENQTSSINRSFINVDYLSDSATGKTKIFEVTNKDKSNILGYIKWWGRWRKYVFYPEKETLFDPKCLIELASICEEKTKQQLKRK